MSKIIKYNTLNLDNNIFNVETPVFNEIANGLDLQQNIQEDISQNEGLDEVAITDEEKELTPEDLLEEAKQKAEEIIQDAEQQAQDKILKAESEARQKAEKIKEEAKQIGYDEGINQANQEMARNKEEINHLLADTQNQCEQMIQDAEPQLIKLTIDIIEKILDDASVINPDVIKCVIKKGLSNTKIIGDIFIHVSENDFDNVFDNKDEILAGAESCANIEITKDLSLNSGDCLIETPFGNIDCGLDTQLNEVKNNLYYILENR